MAYPRILTFNLPVSSGTTHFQIQFSADRETWTNLRVEGTDELEVALVEDRKYVLDGVNTTDDADNNGAAASTPPMFYRYRLKAGGKWNQWSAPTVFPSADDFIMGMKRFLKDPSLSGGNALLDRQDYLLHLANAIDAFEKTHPHNTSQVFDLLTNVQDYDLPDLWAPGYSHVTQVEYPVGHSPRSFAPADYVIYDEETGQWRFRRIWPTATEQARLYFTTRHDRSGETVPESFFESVLMWATGDAAQQLRAKSNQFGDLMLGADFVAIDPRIKEWGRIADSFKGQAEQVWGTGRSSVRAHIPAYEDHGRVPGSVWGF